MGRAVTSSLDLKDVLSTVVSRAVDLTGADAGAVYSYDGTERVFALMEPRGYDQPLIGAVGTIPVDDNEQVLQAAIESETPILIEDIATSQPFRARDAMLAAGFTSVLLVPLRSADEFFGFLVVHWRAAGGVRPRTIELMQTFAHQSVLAIHNAQLFQEIEEKGRQLAIASEHKSQFFANMSHELRTPLNAVLGYAELLIDNLYGEIPEKAKEILGRVQSNGKHLLGLINDVLDLSKIEAGQLTLALEDYSVRAVVDSVIDTTEALAGAKGLALVTDIPEDLPIGRGDERRLMQALLNIVSNAIKFTEFGLDSNWRARGGRVLRAHGDRYRAGYFGRGPGPHLRSVPAGRQQQHPPAGRHRLGPLDRPAAGGAPRRHDRAAIRTRRRLDFHDRAADPGERAEGSRMSGREGRSW